MVVLKLKMASASKRRRTTFLSENEIRRLLENDEGTISDTEVVFCDSDSSGDEEAVTVEEETPNDSLEFR